MYPISGEAATNFGTEGGCQHEEPQNDQHNTNHIRATVGSGIGRISEVIGWYDIIITS